MYQLRLWSGLQGFDDNYNDNNNFYYYNNTGNNIIHDYDYD